MTGRSKVSDAKEESKESILKKNSKLNVKNDESIKGFLSIVEDINKSKFKEGNNKLDKSDNNSNLNENIHNDKKDNITKNLIKNSINDNQIDNEIKFKNNTKAIPNNPRHESDISIKNNIIPSKLEKSEPSAPAIHYKNFEDKPKPLLEEQAEMMPTKMIDEDISDSNNVKQNLMKKNEENSEYEEESVYSDDNEIINYGNEEDKNSKKQNDSDVNYAWADNSAILNMVKN